MMKEKKKLSGIKSWPEDDRPREKLLKKGAGVLTAHFITSYLFGADFA